MVFRNLFSAWTCIKLLFFLNANINSNSCNVDYEYKLSFVKGKMPED